MIIRAAFSSALVTATLTLPVLAQSPIPIPSTQNTSHSTSPRLGMWFQVPTTGPDIVITGARTVGSNTMGWQTIDIFRLPNGLPATAAKRVASLTGSLGTTLDTAIHLQAGDVVAAFAHETPCMYTPGWPGWPGGPGVCFPLGPHGTTGSGRVHELAVRGPDHAVRMLDDRRRPANAARPRHLP